MADLRGHSSRVLHLAMSPDGTTVASAAADETLRFWKVFQQTQSIQSKQYNRGILYNPSTANADSIMNDSNKFLSTPYVFGAGMSLR